MAWAARIAGLAPERFVWLDACSVSTRLVPRRGWGPKGQRVVGAEPRGRWDPSSLLATMTHRGMGPSVVLPGAVDRRAFDQFVEEVLIPALVPGQIVVRDNLSVHRSARAEAALAAAGCELGFLPRYSPDRTPIEQAFSKLKKLKAGLRRAEARTFDAVVVAVSAGYATITARDAAGFIRSARYVP